MNAVDWNTAQRRRPRRKLGPRHRLNRVTVIIIFVPTDIGGSAVDAGERRARKSAAVERSERIEDREYEPIAGAKDIPQRSEGGLTTRKRKAAASSKR